MKSSEDWLEGQPVLTVLFSLTNQVFLDILS
jgi:hypothetical protein